MSTRPRPDTSPGAPHRQWNEILQEIRVMQTGIQILAAFLISLPFQQRFRELSFAEHVTYLVLLIFSFLLILALLLPVLVHRHFFGQRLKPTTVLLGHHVVRFVGVGAGLLMAGCIGFVIQVIAGFVPALIFGGSLMVLALFVLVFLPRMIPPRSHLPEEYDR